jgi:hypothetical protein
MTTPANGRADDGDRLARTLELYRDLTVALSERIALLRSGSGGDAECKGAAGSVKEHRRALQSVLEIEASLGKRRNAWADGTAVELDLAAARAEIAARLLVWAGAA